MNRTSAPRQSSLTSTSQKPPTTRMPLFKNSAKSSTGPSDLVDCRICGRHFAPDRVAKHETICQKSANSKRKVFDILQQRVKGTEAEKYYKKGGKPTTTIVPVNKKIFSLPFFYQTT